MEVLVGKIPGIKNPSILKERDDLIGIIEKNGFRCHEFAPDYEIINYQNSLKNKEHIRKFSIYLSDIYFWPRDLFLYFKNMEIIIKNPIDKFNLGEGGYSVSSPVDNSRIFLSEYFFNENVNFAKEKLRGVEFFNIIHGTKENGLKLKHIDLSCFYSGEHRTLFVDQNYYMRSSKACFEKIKNQEIDVVFFNEEKYISYNYYPANCLSVTKNNINETVFINEASSDLKNILSKDYGIDTVSIALYKNPQFRGSIRCMSNVFESNNPAKFIKKLNEKNLESFKMLIQNKIHF